MFKVKQQSYELGETPVGVMTYIT
ncbi:protein of unknown function [Ruminococcaceae bacterium BL-6]|nr:protein of unknown function [Ruminococcaceae bacterium BL-6]